MRGAFRKPQRGTIKRPPPTVRRVVGLPENVLPGVIDPDRAAHPEPTVAVATLVFTAQYTLGHNPKRDETTPICFPD